jgi:4'-phosphopantetheinyl transferase
MPATSPALLALPELTVGSDSPMEFDYPELTETSAICIGLTIDWRHQDVLRTFALRHTIIDEHERAARFLRPEDSLRNLLGRAMLRQIAVYYGGMDSTQHIRGNLWGKPEPAACSIGCNISHAESQVWVALSRFPHVGIDVESVNAASSFHDIVAGFHPDEIAELRRAPDPMHALARCWSRKEAICKATGMGLSLPLHVFAVECDARQSRWLRVAPPDTSGNEWTSVDIPVGEGFVGALAIEGRCDQVTVLRLKTTA